MGVWDYFPSLPKKSNKNNYFTRLPSHHPPIPPRLSSYLYLVLAEGLQGGGRGFQPVLCYVNPWSPREEDEGCNDASSTTMRGNGSHTAFEVRAAELGTDDRLLAAVYVPIHLPLCNLSNLSETVERKNERAASGTIKGLLHLVESGAKERSTKLSVNQACSIMDLLTEGLLISFQGTSGFQRTVGFMQMWCWTMA